MKSNEILSLAKDTLVEHLDRVVLVTDDQHNVIYANQAALTHLDDRNDTPIGEIVMREFLQSYGTSTNITEEVAIGDENDRWFLATISKILDGQNAVGWIFTACDITDQKIHGTAIDKIIANVSHQFVVPVTNIQLYHQYLTLQPEHLEQFLEILSRETDRLVNLTENVLSLSKLNLEDIEIDKRLIDLKQLVSEYTLDRAALADENGVSLRMDSSLDELWVQANSDHIGQVLGVLLSNALKYTPNGGEVVTKVHKRQKSDKHWAGLSVQDTGAGISEDDKSRLFTRFFRGSAGHKAQVKGSGLGLAIAKEIIDQHGGEIDVESEGIPGKGTRFTVWLPMND